MSDILDEVLRDQSDEQKLKFIKKLIPVAAVATIVLVLIMSIYQFYSNRKIDHNKEMGDILLKTIMHDEFKEELVLKSLELLANTAENGAAELSAIREAGLLIKQNRIIDARKILINISEKTSLQNLSNAYARLIFLYITVEDEKISELERQKVREYCSYFNSEKIPFYGMASIMTAVWYIKNDQQELAEPILNKLIASPNIAEIIREQAKALLLNTENKQG